MAIKECYCQILGINPFKESEYDWDRLDDIISKSVAKWMKESTILDADTRLAASKHLEIQSDISDAMENPDTRKEQFEEGRKRLNAKLSPLLLKCVITEDGKKYAFPRTVNDMLTKIGWKGITADDVSEILGLEDGRPEPPVSSDVSNSLSYVQMVKASTPAEAINSLISNPKLKIECHLLTETSGAKSIKEAINECSTRLGFVRLTEFPEQNTYVDCLRKLNTLSDDEMDLLVRYSRCYRDLDTAMEELGGMCTYINRKDIDELLPSDIDLDMAIPILQNFCYKKGIGANFSGSDMHSERCPRCSGLIIGHKDVMVCPHCGTHIKAECPRCKTVQNCTNRVCIKCGFDFVNDVNNAKRLAIGFRSNLRKGNIPAAKANLAAIKDSYSSTIKTNKLELELEECERNLGKYTRMATDAYRSGRYYASLKAFNALHRNYPEVLPNNLELDNMRRSADECFQLAQKECLAAEEAADEKEKLEHYIKAAEHCMDHPSARGFLRNHPPQSLTNCEAVPTKYGTILIKFTPPADSKGLSYCIYRGTDIPAVNEDTDPFEVISKQKAETGYEDKTAESGVKYHYVLCSRRWGILSKPMQHIGPVVTFENVKKVSINPTNDGFHISFTRPEKAFAVRISRCVKGDETHCTDVEIGNKDECDDYCLVGNVYIYYFWTEYMVGNVLESSA